MSMQELKAGDRVRLTASHRKQGYRPGDKGIVLRVLGAGPGGDFSYLVAMEKDDPDQKGVVFAEDEIEPDE